MKHIRELSLPFLLGDWDNFYALVDASFSAPSLASIYNTKVLEFTFAIFSTTPGPVAVVMLARDRQLHHRPAAPKNLHEHEP